MRDGKERRVGGSRGKGEGIGKETTTRRKKKEVREKRRKDRRGEKRGECQGGERREKGRGE